MNAEDAIGQPRRSEGQETGHLFEGARAVGALAEFLP